MDIITKYIYYIYRFINLIYNIRELREKYNLLYSTNNYNKNSNLIIE